MKIWLTDVYKRLPGNARTHIRVEWVVQSPKNVLKADFTAEFEHTRLLPPRGHLGDYTTETKDVNNSSRVLFKKGRCSEIKEPNIYTCK